MPPTAPGGARGARPFHTNPVPGCPACARGRVCPYHSAKSSEELTQRFGEDLAREGCTVVADFYGAGFAALELLPVACLSQVVREEDLDTSKLQEEMAKLSRKRELSADDFRRLAAVSLALATAIDVQDSYEGDEEGT